MDDKTKGLYGKFKVERTDGRSAPGEKHDGCEYFVLDVTHDPFAAPALRAYAAACGDAGYYALALDIRAMQLRVKERARPREAGSGGRDE